MKHAIIPPNASSRTALHANGVTLIEPGVGPTERMRSRDYPWTANTQIPYANGVPEQRPSKTTTHPAFLPYFPSTPIIPIPSPPKKSPFQCNTPHLLNRRHNIHGPATKDHLDAPYAEEVAKGVAHDS